MTLNKEFCVDLHLAKDVVFWAVASLLYIAFCYRLGELAIEVRRKFVAHDFGDFSTSPFVRLILYPLNSLALIENNRSEPAFFFPSETKLAQVTYKFSHVILLPAKLLWFVCMLSVFYITVPLICLLVAGVVAMVRGCIHSLRQTL